MEYISIDLNVIFVLTLSKSNWLLEKVFPEVPLHLHLATESEKPEKALVVRSTIQKTVE